MCSSILSEHAYIKLAANQANGAIGAYFLLGNLLICCRLDVAFFIFLQMRQIRQVWAIGRELSYGSMRRPWSFRRLVVEASKGNFWSFASARDKHFTR